MDGRTEITLSIAAGDAKLISLEEYAGTLHCISYNTGITSEIIALSSNQYVIHRLLKTIVL